MINQSDGVEVCDTASLHDSAIYAVFTDSEDKMVTQYVPRTLYCCRHLITGLVFDLFFGQSIIELETHCGHRDKRADDS